MRNGHRLTVLGAVLIVALSLSSEALAKGRVALVIGQDNYTSASRLSAARADAGRVAKALRSAGYRVTEASDLNRAGFISALDAFKTAAATADKAVIYYAGLGLQACGDAWLLPTDVQIKAPADLSRSAVTLQAAREALAPARDLKVLIVDASRDEPFERSAGCPPAAARDGVTGLITLYPTVAGGTTWDMNNGEPGGALAAALSRRLARPADVRELFAQVVDDVRARSGGQQTPEIVSSLGAGRQSIAGR